ncbi:MAG: hypothetical protein PUP92_21265 [Rhizonema sp. PD38]|nr:hypothetical protein [Rhizonema sp. PD38]
MTQRDPKEFNQLLADSYKQTASDAVENAIKVTCCRGQNSSSLSLLAIDCIERSNEYQRKADES